MSQNDDKLISFKHKRRSNMDITTLGIDLAKNSMQLHGIDNIGNVVVKKKISRNKLIKYIANLKPSLIGMEACGSANYWARKFKSFGHTVKLMNPKFVKPYVKSNKNDANDAEAICEAVTRPNMRFVGIKNIQQQDMQTLHRIRSQLIKARTAITNQIRGLLAEYGIIIPKQIQNISKYLPEILEDAENKLTYLSRELFNTVYLQFKYYEQQISHYDCKIHQFYKTDEKCKQISKVPGVGPVIATAITTVLSEPNAFKNGREFAAFIGLVPKQCSTGGKSILLGISKRGNRYLRTQLIHGARAVVSTAAKKTDSHSLWINGIRNTKGFNKASVALANKNARVIWALLANNQQYRSAA
jgi:transposase